MRGFVVVDIFFVLPFFSTWKNAVDRYITYTNKQVDIREEESCVSPLSLLVPCPALPSLRLLSSRTFLLAMEDRLICACNPAFVSGRCDLLVWTMINERTSHFRYNPTLHFRMVSHSSLTCIPLLLRFPPRLGTRAYRRQKKNQGWGRPFWIILGYGVWKSPNAHHHRQVGYHSTYL